MLIISTSEPFSRGKQEAKRATYRVIEYNVPLFWQIGLASCQVSLNFVKQLQRISRKYLNKLEAGVAILFFWSAQKTQTL